MVVQISEGGEGQVPTFRGTAAALPKFKGGYNPLPLSVFPDETGFLPAAVAPLLHNKNSAGMVLHWYQTGTRVELD